MRRTAAIIVLVAIALAAAGTGVWLFLSRKEKVPVFLTVAVKRGDVATTISATGTLEPEAAVDIGAQVAGVIVAFGKNKYGQPISWDSVVEEGTVLANIDDSLYAAAVATAKAQLSQGEASVQASEANVLTSEANVLQQKANLLLATQNWERAQKLGPSDALAQSAYDQYQANYEVAKPNLAAAEAALEQAKAAVQQAKALVEQDKATLLTAQINLNYCTIKSPVKGVVVDRRVNIGQTVVSSLSAPSLFLIATDLLHIQAWISVNEADVGSISQGQPATFTVDAIPGRVFHGRVGQVRLNATMTQNVVTYTVEVDIHNFDGKLLPYLTVNAQFETGRRKGVLLVPNAALRWSPPTSEIAPDLGRQPNVQLPRPDHVPEEARVRATLWIQEGRFVRPVPATAGLTDGTFTEVEGEGVKEGLRVVIGEAARETEGAQTAGQNPFAPQIFRGQRPAQGQEQGTPGQAAPSSGEGREKRPR